MLAWLSQNLANIVICLLLLALVGWIVYGLVKQKKRGGSACGSGCSGCPMSGSCHKQ